MHEALIAAAGWIWIPITVAAALTQTGRNALQRGLIKELGIWGATLIRFLYGLPFALLVLVVMLWWISPARPSPTWTFWVWCSAAALGQIMAAYFLLQVMAERNFAIGIAYSKTELIQIAAVSLVLLGDPVTGWALVAILIATVGVLLLSPPVAGGVLAAIAGSVTSRAALLGIACGASFAFTTTGFRGAILSLAPAPLPVAVSFCLASSMAIQTVVLGGFLLMREPGIAGKLARHWKASLPAGFLGAFASLLWMVALALATAAQVRTVGLIEVLFGLIVSRRFLAEEVPLKETIGASLIVVAVVVMLWLG